MTVTPETMIGLMVVLLLMALVLVAFLMRGLRKNRSERRRRVTPPAERQAQAAQVTEPAPEAVTAEKPSVSPTAPTPLKPEATPVAATPPVARPGETLLMQVWQDRDGVLVVETEGKRYRRLFEIRDGKVGRRVIETIHRLVAFSKGEVARVAPAPRAETPAAPVDLDRRVEAVVEEFKKPPLAPKKVRISTDPVPLRRRSEAQNLHLTLNLAEEIDRMLQIRVNASPEFQARYIHVLSAPDGSLRFNVDGTQHGSLDEVPDPDVQALIRAAISDWEARR